MSNSVVLEEAEVRTRNGRSFNPSELPPGMKQFIKFCIVGAGSTFIDWSVFWMVLHLVLAPNHVGANVVGHVLSPEHGWFRPVSDGFETTLANICSVTCGIINSFYWNSRWTFRVLDATNRRQQFRRFVAVNIVGLILNTIIVNLILLPSSLAGRPRTRILTLCAKAPATAIVVFWNFFANKKWTFQPPTEVSR